MSDFQKMIDSVKTTGDYETKCRLLNLFINYMKRSGKRVPASEAEQFKNLAVYELKNLLPAIKKLLEENAPYKQKSELFGYKEILLGLFEVASGGLGNAKAEETELIRSIEDIVEKETVVEVAVIKLFDHSVIVKSDVEAMLSVMENITDIYRIGIMYSGLFYYREKISKFEPDAKSTLAEYVVRQTNAMLESPLDEDGLLALEYIADVCAYFPTEAVVELLQRILKTSYNRPRYYAVDTLLKLKATVNKAVIDELARDVSIASLTYALLEKNGRLDLYPNEYSNEEYLAKSDLTQWLLYPTELGKLPDKIEHIGKGKVKKSVYHIFRYTSDSATLSNDLKNEWLIGWSCLNGGTFSNFDKLSEYEKKTPEKTIRNILKRLIK